MDTTVLAKTEAPLLVTRNPSDIRIVLGNSPYEGLVQRMAGTRFDESHINAVIMA